MADDPVNVEGYSCVDAWNSSTALLRSKRDDSEQKHRRILQTKTSLVLIRFEMF
jgi:hypothetical protein